MIRVMIFLVVILALALGASWMADHPGTVAITFAGQQYVFSTLVGLSALIALVLVLILVWNLISFVFRAPSMMSGAAATRKRERGYRALSRGMIAVGSGDAELARRYAADATRLLKHEFMALLLQAQSAQLSGDRKQAEDTFTAMLQHPETRTLALRGLHMEALRRHDPAAALAHAEAAQKIATLPWSTKAIIEARAAEGRWQEALTAIERAAGARILTRTAANRQRAVLMTATALDGAQRAPDEALAHARNALALAPTLEPAAALAGKLLADKGELKRATKIIETAYAASPHPELAEVYLHLRHGNSAADRLARAEALARRAAHDPETALMLAQAALDARDFERARRELSGLIEAGRPTRRTCLLMAEIEQAEHGDTGARLEWLQRASRAARDPAWVADGAVFDRWAPISPVSGRLDAFVWTTPVEQLGPDQHTISHAVAGPAPSRVTAQLDRPKDERAPIGVEASDLDEAPDLVH